MSPRKLVAGLLIVSQLTLAVPALADGPMTLPTPKPVPGEVDVGAAVSPLRKGQAAPFSGVLLSPKAVASITVQLNSIQDQIKVEVDRATGEAKAQCDFQVSETKTHLEADKKVLQAQVDENQKRIDALNKALKTSEDSRSNTPYWVGLGAGVGLVIGVATSVVTVYAVNRASK